MGALKALVPLPYRILALFLLVAACLGTAYFKGRNDEGDSRDIQAAKQERAMLKAQGAMAKKLDASRAKSKFNQGRIAAEGAAANERIDNRGEIAGECPVPFAPDRLRNIESAWGIPPRDGSGRVPPRVREPETPAE
jgi:hypothetical protein